MPTLLADTLSRIRATWAHLGRRRRLGVVTVALAGVAGVVWLVLWQLPDAGVPAGGEEEVPANTVSGTEEPTMARWSAVADASGATLDSGAFLALQRLRSEELTAVAQALLDRLFPGRAVAHVRVELDNQWNVTTERSASDNPVVLRSKTSRESTDVAAAADAAATEVGTQTPRGRELNKQVRETEYSEASFRETTTGRLAPAIQRLSAAVVIDPAALGDADPVAIRAQLARAIGWSESRDNPDGRSELEVLVQALPEPPPAFALDQGASVAGFLARHAATLGQLLGVTLLLAFLALLLRRPRTPAPAALPEQEADREPPALPRHREEIEQSIARDPAAMARLLESWLLERKP